MHRNTLFSLFISITVLTTVIFTGCAKEASISEQEAVIIPPNPPNRKASSKTPELFIYTRNKITSNYTEAYFYFFDSKKHYSYFSLTENFDDYGYIKKRGNSTAQSQKKPFNIKFEQKKDFFGMGKAKKWVLLSNPYDPALIRNKLIYDLASNLSFVFSPKSYFFDVWLNGTFMGNYQIVQKIGFQKNRIPYDVDNGDFLFELVESEIRNNINDNYFFTPIDSFRITLTEPDTPSHEQKKDFSKKLKRIEKAIGSKDIKQYIQHVDLRSIIDYYWIEEFVNNPDLHTGSIFFTIHDGILRGGPVWDFDLALGNTRTSQKAATKGLNAQKIWWAKLFQDSVFQKIAYERYLQIEPYFDNLANDNELGKNKIDSVVNYFRNSFDHNFSDSGWAYCDSLETDNPQEKRTLDCPFNPTPLPTFDENIQFLRNWITERNLYIKETVSSRLKKLSHLELDLEQVLTLQDSIFESK